MGFEVREEACSLVVDDSRWVEEALFIGARSHLFSRNPNDFPPILPSFSLPFSPHPFNHLLVVKFTLLLCIKSGILGAQGPLSRGCL
ncbi:hypothetical protein ACE6H2_026560 [Prunus campanulata]